MLSAVNIMFSVFLLFFGSKLSANISLPVKTIQLKNGLKILFHENNTIPNANMYLFWKVGARNERPGITGLAHFFEHMMFNGSKKYKPGEFDTVMEANGGSNNAYTTKDLTVYTDWFPSRSLEKIFELESDRIGYLKLDDKMIESERNVVLSERSTGLENSNWRLLSSLMGSTAYTVYPYTWPVIGHESDIKNWKKKDLIEFYKTYYSPRNAILVISGAVKIHDVEKLAKEYLESLPNGPSYSPITAEEPAQNGEKRYHLIKKSVSAPNIMETYQIPATSNKDYYALSLLATILGEGKSSRLSKELVDKEGIASAIETYLPNSIGPGLFYIYAISTNKKNKEYMLGKIHNVIESIKNKGVTKKELQKAKNIKLMELYQSLETINGISNSIGTYEIYFGSYKKLFEAPKYYDRVTPEEIVRITKKYFNWSNRTIGILTSKK